LEKSRMDKGFTKVPNILLNNLVKRRFTGVELKLILVIWRYSYGFSRESAELSIGFLAKEIDSSPSVVSRILSRLISNGIIKVSYVNPSTKVRCLMVNNDIGSWGIDQKTTIDLEVKDGIDQEVNDVLTGKSTEVLTKRSTYIYNNINIYLNIKERTEISPKLEEGFVKWLEYKNERGEIYGRIPMLTLVGTIVSKAEKWSEESVLELIDECIASGYKNIVWEKLKHKQLKKACSYEDRFLSGYDHSVLEKLSRGTDDDE